MVDPRFKDLHFLALASERKELWDLLDAELRRLCPEASLSDSNEVKCEAAAEPPSKDVSTSDDHDFDTDLWDGQDQKSDPITAEIDAWRRESRLERKGDPLLWLKKNAHRFPLMVILAKRYLCIPAPSALSERVFSKMGIVVEKRRNRLKPDRVEHIVFMQHNHALLSDA